MKIALLGLSLLSTAKVAALEAAARDAGHEIVVAEENEVAALWQEAKAKFPDLVAGLKKGIADAEDSTISGGEKAVKVATDAIALVPAVLADLPELKSFLVHGVTDLYNEGKTALVTAAKGLIGKL